MLVKELELLFYLFVGVSNTLMQRRVTDQYKRKADGVRF